MYEIYVKKPGKYDGKMYATGDAFPYDPDNLNHEQAFFAHFLGIRKVEQKKTSTKRGK